MLRVLAEGRQLEGEGDEEAERPDAPHDAILAFLGVR
jgi:hypothetical protein